MDSIVEKQKDPCLMKTHFLKPYVTSIDGLVADLPRNRHSVSSSDLKDSFSRISFTGFWFADGNFRSWAKKMEALHEPTWRKAGIFEAIKTSTYKIVEDQSLISALVQKWCPETKSFVFPWGEATITLEDVMVILGFSVLGSPVFAPLESSEMRDSVEKLEKARVEILENMRNNGGRVSQVQWILSFRDSDDSMEEHEAFLAMWLSHFVFPQKSRRSISKIVLPIAVRLARGERIALATPVLASIYRDFGQIQAFARDKSTKDLNLKSLFKLVQVWAWERFRDIRPEAREISKGEPRIAQWSCLNQRDKNNEKKSLSFDDFDWRPYTKPLENWNPPRFYLEEAMWMTVDDDLDDEFLSFARCVRSSQLVGIGFVEGYYPNRVAMQFGFSQDLPGLVSDHSSFTEKEAWEDYNKSLDGLKLYVPSRLATTSVTARYRNWWLKSVSKFLRSEESNETFHASNAVDDDDASPKVKLLCQALQSLGEGFAAKRRRCKICDCGESTSTEVPLSEFFQKELGKRTSEHKRRKRARLEDDDEDCNEDTNITIAQLIKCSKKTGGKRSRFEDDDNNDSGICQNLASGDDETVAPQEIETGSKAEKITVLNSSDEKNFEDPLVDSNGGVVDIVVSPPEARQTCDVNGSNAENKKTMVDDGTKEAECLVAYEDREKERVNEIVDDDCDERLNQRKLAINEIASNLEARINKVEKTLETIRKWKTRRNHIQTGVSP